MIQYQTVPSSAPEVAHAPSCSRALIDRMADDMREMAFSGQTVSGETLAQRGWTAPSIKRLLPEAITKARRQSVRRL